ncbi:hypothetical protein IW261DRAFT_1454689 [Armillaria novae-zelandiae]|uniref:DUF6697 domain-containing protein n=1 Tax=Armillaria novae-zelandiae TaxID=153914 RepID=A0AA39PM99_9AGAR|nr:hypothetical protein IW261DRAFT_1454689 [Armillaria novae-zelandiae]
MSLSRELQVVQHDTEAQIEDLKRERDKSRAQYVETLKKLRRKADVERDNDGLRKENERLKKDLEETRAMALKANDDATDMWGQKVTIEDENRDLKRLVARLQHRLEELTLSGVRAQVKVENFPQPAMILTPSPSLTSHSTTPEIINLIDDDDDDMVIDGHPPGHSVGSPSPPMVVKSEPSVDITASPMGPEGGRVTKDSNSTAVVQNETNSLNVNASSEDEFDPNNMEIEITQQESNERESNRSVSPKVTESIGRFFNTMNDVQDQTKDFDIKDVRSIVDDESEEAQRSKRMRQLTPTAEYSSASTPESNSYMSSKGKRKSASQLLGGNDYLSQIERTHLKDAKYYTIHPAAPEGFYIPRVFVADTYGGSAYQFLQTLKARNIKCVWPKKGLNPLVVDAPGAPGLMFTSRLEIADSKPWHVFSERQVDKQARWEYMGIYESVVSGRIEAEQFSGQSEGTKMQWGKLLLSSKKADVYVAMRARIALRKHGLRVDNDSDMTKDEKRKVMNEIKAREPLAITAEEIVDAFRNDDEHIKILRWECVGYDHAFVKDMQEKLPHWKPKSKAMGQKASGRDSSGPSTLLRRTLRQTKSTSRLRELREEEEEGDKDEISDEDSDYEY